MQKNTQFLGCAAGIFVSYFYFGILQEKITKGKYAEEVVNEDGTKSVTFEKYTYVLSLVFAQCLVSYVFAKVVVSVKKETEEKASGLNVLYCAAAMTYLLAMVCSNMALEWVPYPTQVVGKSAKPIPVMILGVLVGKKSYAMQKYFFVLLVVVGVVLFMYKDQAAASSNAQETVLSFGELLLLLSLTMDGLTGAMQEIMRTKGKPSGEQMMLSMNFWSCIYLGVALLVTGESMQFINFVNRHPYVLANIAVLAVAGSVGQHFIYLMVSGFGPLPVSIVTTTRKFITVLASVLIFGNTLLPRQWLGALIVFTGLFLDAFYKSPPKKKEVN